MSRSNGASRKSSVDARLTSLEHALPRMEQVEGLSRWAMLDFARAGNRG